MVVVGEEIAVTVPSDIAALVRQIDRFPSVAREVAERDLEQHGVVGQVGKSDSGVEIAVVNAWQIATAGSFCWKVPFGFPLQKPRRREKAEMKTGESPSQHA